MALTDRVDARVGGIAAASGVVAYVLGYLVVYVTQRSWVDEQLRTINVVADLFGGDPIPSWQGIGWLFYNAHFVDTEIPALGGTQVRNFIATADDGSLTLLYLVPPLLLVAAGFATASLAGVRDPGESAPLGGLVAVGYLPLTILGAFAFRYAVGDGSVTPDLLTAVVIAGVVYPVAFGAAGGAIAGVVGDDRG